MSTGLTFEEPEDAPSGPTPWSIAESTNVPAVAIQSREADPPVGTTAGSAESVAAGRAPVWTFVVNVLEPTERVFTPAPLAAVRPAKPVTGAPFSWAVPGLHP